ncbi:Protein of unknown function precursor [Flavobacterium indicum GPTSA100-9 = DSM 17447]|uniref:Secreted protein n=1 Tax=Flavobacterium indicum (strain DSM 17447 / CIP 109464 / GPTSA100-9) TaxID=1094466 RepID=H8XVQ2_FLAIG|nr:hypothetical protein [Flavobacterium indicum]CCG54016.1 Protein of unknown function precursor [Flavobacterium indicum GPTSA100-9 = DSM 17447]
MKKLQFSIFLLLISLVGSAQKGEQKQRLEVFIDGKTYFTNENDTLLVNNKPITIKIAKTQIFSTDKISFEYQNHFSLETEKDFGVNTYTLDGDDVVLTYFDFITSIETQDLAEEMIKEFGKKNCKLLPANITLNSKTYEGNKVAVNILNSKLTIEIYKISNKKNQTQILAIQDSKNDDGSDSSEYQKAIAILNKTLDVK